MRPLDELLEGVEDSEEALRLMQEEMRQSAIGLDVRDQSIIFDQMILAVAMNLVDLIMASAPPEVRERAKDEFQEWATYQRVALAYQLLHAKRAQVTGGGKLIVPKG